MAARSTRGTGISPAPVAAKVHLDALSARFDETALISQLVDKRAVCVALAESRRPLHLSVYVGQEMPLHAAASARVLYSDFSREDVKGLFPTGNLTQLMPGTPITLDAVMDHLENIHQYGYDICDNEFDLNVWAVSAPIRSDSSQIIGGITLTMPQERSHSEQLRHEVVQAVLRTASDIEKTVARSF